MFLVNSGDRLCEVRKMVKIHSLSLPPAVHVTVGKLLLPKPFDGSLLQRGFDQAPSIVEPQSYLYTILR